MSGVRMLLNEADALQASLDDAAKVIGAQRQTISELRKALEEIAKHVPAKDMDGDYYDAADFEDGYDRCIFRARAALKATGEAK